MIPNMSDVRPPTSNKLEVNETPAADQSEELYEEISALEQAMQSEETQAEGSFLTGGNTRDFVELSTVELELDEQVLMNPQMVKDGPALLDFLRANLHRFDSPYAYLGGEANSPDRERFHTAEVRILIGRLSTYESTSLSMSHSLMAQVYGELPFTFCDFAFLPKPNDYALLKEQGFSVWFGNNSKLAPHRFDLLSLTHAVSMEQLNFAPLLHDSGIPLFKEQRMERADIPLIVVGGANSGTTAPLSGTFVDSQGRSWNHFIDAVVYGDGEEAAQELVHVIREGKQKGWTKREILRACHGRVQGFYEPDCYVHEYDGQGILKEIRIAEGREYAEFPVKRATVMNLDTVRTLETKVLPYTGDGACLAAGTTVATDRGRLSIENVQPGDHVVTPAGLREVKKVFHNGKKPVWKLETQWGYSIRVTGNHHLQLVDKGTKSLPGRFSLGAYKAVADLEIGDYLAIQEGTSAVVDMALSYEASEHYVEAMQVGRRISAPRLKTFDQPEVSPDLAELLGYIAGDGSLSYCAVRLFFAWHEGDAKERYVGLMKSLFALEPGIEQRKNGSETSSEVPFQTSTLAEQMRKWGVKERAPEFIRRGTEQVKAAYLRGLYTADGSIAQGDRNDIELGLTNEALIRDVQLLLLDLGIYAGISRIDAKQKGKYLHAPSFRLIVRGTQSWMIFREKVAFSTKHKNRRLEGVIKRNQGTNGVFQEGWAADKILAITLDGEEDVYDLHVEDQHCYTANGIVVHNSVDVAIAGSVGCIGCIAHGAVIMTGRGQIPIQDIVIGDIVTTRTGLGKVKEVKHTGHKDLIQLETEWGYRISLTPNHEVATVGTDFKGETFRHAGQFKIGDLLKIRPGQNSLVETVIEYDAAQEDLNKVVYGGNYGGGGAKRRPSNIPLQTSPELGYLLGYLSGDGSFDQDGTKILIAHHEQDLYPILDRAMKNQFGLSHGAPYTKGGCTQYTYGSRTVRNFLMNHMKLKEQIPSFVRTATKETKAAYLRGLFDADGSVSTDNGHVYVASTKPDYLREIQLLLLDLSVYSCLRMASGERKKAGTDYICKPSWHLYIRGWFSLKRFQQDVNFTTARKRNFLTGRKTHLTYAGTGFHQEDATFLKIKSIEPAGSAEVYDLAIEEGDHSYVAQGITVHNSAGWGACSFCREGSEGPYRERSLDRVMTALDSATKNQGTKEVSFFCFAPDTLLLTDEGLKRFDETETRHQLLDYQGLSPIKALEKRAIQPTLTIKTRLGLDLTITPDHEVQTWVDLFPFHQRKKAKDLRPGDRIIGKLGGYEHVKGTALGRNLPELEAELLGLLTGDGYKAAGKARLYVANHEQDLRAWVDENTVGYWNQRKDNTEIRIFDLPSLAYLTKSRLPEPIRQAPATQVAAYLRGVFEADGSVDKAAGALYLSLKQKTRAKETALALRHLGIATRLSTIQGVNPWTKKPRIYHEVHVVGGRARARFAQLVGFLSESKNKALAEWVLLQDRSEPFNLPQVIRSVLANLKDAHKEAYGDVPVLWKRRASVFTRNDDPLSSATVRELIQPSKTQTIDSERLLAFFEQDLTLETVTEVEEGPTTETYDAVDSRYGYIVADGLIASQSLNFNQYTDFFGLVAESVRRGYKVGLISQRVDMLAETPEQIRVQRWLKKSNYTLGVEGISGRMRAYLNKNLQEWELLLCCTEMMKEGAGELKLFQIATGMEQDVDVEEFCRVMEKINAIRQKLGASTRFRVSFTPLFPSAFTVLQFAPCLAAIDHGTRSLDKLFTRAKELGWGRRLSVSGEEPLISNTINHGGRNITQLLLKSHFCDGFRFYGNVPKGTWIRWKRRIQEDPNIDTELMWGEKSYEYIFPWEDISYSTSKQVLWRGYVKAVAFQGITYCLSTRTIKGICHLNECGACDPQKTGKPNAALIKAIVGRKVGKTIPVEQIERDARAREKAYHLRVLFQTEDPIYRFIMKGYFQNSIPRALMTVSKRFNWAYVGPLGHARIGAGANLARDWTFGKNIYDFAISEPMSEIELKSLIGPANEYLREGRILDLRMDTHLTVLRNDVDYAVYTMFIPNSEVSFQRLRSDTERYFERKFLGREAKIKIKKAFGKGIFKTIEASLDGKDVRALEYQFMPEHRGTVFKMAVSAAYNPMSLLEAITGRKAFTWKAFPIFCDGYVQLPPETGEVDVFAALAGEEERCRETGEKLETDLFTGKPLATGVSLSADLEVNFPTNMELFFTKELRAIDGDRQLQAAA